MMSAQWMWKVILLSSVTLARVGQGLYLSIPGPTLLFLSETYAIDVSRVSLMFTLRSVGMMIGAVAYSAITYYFKEFNPVSGFGPGAFFLGLMTALTPWYKSLGGLLISSMVSGFMFSFSDGAMTTTYLRIWGEKKSRPYIQSFHFGISLGGLLAPIIASPFLNMANQSSDSDPGCPEGTKRMTTSILVAKLENETYFSSSGGTNPISWSYVIAGGFSMVISIPLFILWLIGIENRISSHDKDVQDPPREEPIRDVWLMLVLVGMFFFLNDALEATYANYIYSVTLCMGLGFTVDKAANLNSLFWTGYTISRFFSIIYSNFFKPSTIIRFCICLLIVSTTVMCVYGQTIPLVVWVSTSLFGLSVATFYPTGITWTSRVTNISGGYMFVFMFSAGLDSMVMLPLAGFLFELYPFYVIYLVTGAAVAIGFVFIGMEYAAAMHRNLISMRMDDSRTNVSISTKL